MAATRFDPDEFVAACRTALADSTPQQSLREIVARAVADSAAVLRAFGAPERGGIREIHRSDDITVLDVVWGPHMKLMPHDHRMTAVIGVYAGREDNVFWRRIVGEAGRIESAGAKTLDAGDAALLGRDVIHSVTNPIPRCTGALHVYTGDFFATPRSEWDPETLAERPYDVEKVRRAFARSSG